MTEAWERGVGSGAGTSDLPIALKQSSKGLQMQAQLLPKGHLAPNL